MDKIVTRDILYNLRKKNYLSAESMERSLEMGELLSNRISWRLFINYTCLFLGTALLLSGIIFFFAYNWNSLHKFAKLGILESTVFLCAILALYKGLDNIVGKIFLLSASILVGGLLAVYGQIYQTGADAYELFVGWSLLITGWVFISRFSVLWFIWLILINFAISLRHIQLYPGWEYEHILFYALTLINFIALFSWEYFFLRNIKWLKGRWIPALICGGLHFLLANRTMVYVFETQFSMFYLLYCAFIGISFWFYLNPQKDLFMLTMGCISLICVITSIIGKSFVNNAESIFILSVVVLIQAGIAGYWLRKVMNSWKQVQN